MSNDERLTARVVDIVERLRDPPPGFDPYLLGDAAVEIERLRAVNARLDELLREHLPPEQP